MTTDLVGALARAADRAKCRGASDVVRPTARAQLPPERRAPANRAISLLVWGRIGHEVACGDGVIELGIIGLR